MKNSVFIEEEAKTDFGFVPYQLTNKEVIPPSQKEMAYFQEYLIADIKMLLLKDATLNLSRSYSDKGVKVSGYAGSLFFEYSDFKKEVCDLAENLKFTEEEKSGLKNTLNQYQEFIHLKAPKISFPWIAYSLCKTYKDLPEYNKRSDFNLVRGKNLALKYPGRNQYNKSYKTEDILKEAQNKLLFFSNYLKGFSKDHNVNKSLTMYLFNETTNLLDLHILFKNFQEKNSYFKIQNSSKENLNQINDHFKSLSKLGLIAPLGLKSRLVDFLRYEEIYSDEDIWSTLDNLCTIIVFYLLCIFEEEKIVEGNNSLSIDHYLYDQLKHEEPYDIKPFSKSLSIYKENNSVLDSAYFYVYKNLYETKFKNGKNKYQYENY